MVGTNGRRPVVAPLALCAIVGTAAIRARAEGGELVRNGGFEDGKPGALPEHWSQQKEGGAEGTVAVSRDQAYSGEQGLVVAHTNRTGYIHPNHTVQLEPGTYVYSLRARGEAEEVLAVQLYDARAWGEPRPKQLQLGNGMFSRKVALEAGAWREIEYVLTVTEAFPASIQIGLTGGGKAWLDDVSIRPAPADVAVSLWDTGRGHAAALAPGSLKPGPPWKKVVARPFSFTGDACLANRHLAVVARRGADTLELYHRSPGGVWSPSMRVWPIGEAGRRGGAIAAFSAFEVYGDTVVLDVGFGDDGGERQTLRLSCRQDAPFVESEGRDACVAVAAEARPAFTVVPDQFGNDLVLNWTQARPGPHRFPSEHTLLHFTHGGDAILMLAWLLPEQSVTVTPTTSGEFPPTVVTEVRYARDKCANVWLAPLTAPGIWHRKPVSELRKMPDATRLEWRMPFPARWRVDFRREQDDLIDSWIATTKLKNGNWAYCNDNGSRTMWTSARGTFAYPAFIEHGTMNLVNTVFRKAFAWTHLPGVKDLTFKGAGVALMYPYERTGDTPSAVHTPRDVVRLALEATPELDLHDRLAPANMPKHRFPATCAVTGRFEAVFNDEQEQQKRRSVLADLRRMNYFVLNKRERIDEYMDWVRGMESFCDETRAGQPGVAELVDAFAKTIDRISQTYTKGRAADMKTPADCQAVVERVVALTDTPISDDKIDEVKELGKQARRIGGAQDSVLGCMRQIVKELRQQAGYAMLGANNDEEFRVARDVRRRTMELLHRTCGHEGR